MIQIFYTQIKMLDQLSLLSMQNWLKFASGLMQINYR